MENQHAGEDQDLTLHNLLPPEDDGEPIDWDAVERRCRSHPREATLEYTNRYNCYALHAAVKQNPSPESVYTIIHAHTDALDIEDDGCFSPLALACKYDASPDVIRMLLHSQLAERRRKSTRFHRDTYEAYRQPFPLLRFLTEGEIKGETVRLLLEEIPTGALSTYHEDYGSRDCNIIEEILADRYFDSWYHDLTEATKDNLWNTLQLLLDFGEHGTVDPRFLSDRPRSRLQTLIQHTCKPAPAMTNADFARGFADDISEHYANIFIETSHRDPQQFSDRDRHGQLPLHILLFQEWRGAPNSSNARRLLRIFLDAYPSAAGVPNSSGVLPLNMALFYGWPFEEILGAEPRALQTRSVLTGVYPGQFALKLLGDLWRFSDVSEEELVPALNAAFVLLRADPMLVMNSALADFEN